MPAAIENSDMPTAPHNSPPPKHNMQHTTSTPAPQDTSPSKDEPISLLLDLPLEIRTLIWDFALTSPTPIRITDQLKQPALTHVNRQIRSETRKLALLNNNYRIDIVACDARLLSKFSQLWDRIINPDYKNIKTKTISLPIRLGLVGDCHWLNLVTWYRLVRRGKCVALRSGPAARGRSKIIEAATGLAANAGTWGEVERGLGAWREVAGMDDPQWLEDLELAE